MLKIEVEDTGCGISPERQLTIFETASRSQSTRGGHTEGLGIGLPTNVGLVKLFGGTIELESEVGQGSTFRVELPFECADGRNEDDEILPAIGSRVLVLDEIAVSRRSIETLLAGWRFDATGVETIEDAFDILEAAESLGLSIDILVLSSTLERRGARKLIARMRDDPRFFGNFRRADDAGSVGQPARGRRDCGGRAIAAAGPKLPASRGALCDVMAARRRRGKPAATNMAAVQAQAEAATGEAADKIEKIDVLVAEDNEVSALACEQILKSLGLNFRIARDGEQAVHFWNLYKPEIVIMDVLMPRMNGYEATAAIRAAEAENALSRTPIIAITARTLDHDRNACLDADMDDYLPKPFTPELLAAKIDIWRSLVAGEAKITDDFIRSA